MGPTINRAARVRDLAHGGQTVLTATTEDLVVDQLPHGTWLADLGSHTLRGIPRPERVVQLCHPDLRVEFPPLRSANTVDVQSIPVQLTTFVGRTAEIAELRAALAEHRLVTLTGAGGVGKTRLAVQLTGHLADDIGGTIHYVDLAPITDPDLVEAAVARAVGLPDQPGRSAIDSLARRIADRPVLIVLDNCEHLLEATAALVTPLLSSCPALRLLATSREPLRSEAEVTWQVPSLSLTDDAVELFTDRARHVRPDFSVTDANVGTVTEICRRLDGMPLAIELAAARMRALSPTEILASLHDRFRLLTGGARTAVRRQQTLRASVDWSHSLLTQAEAVLFRRLAAFAAGFDLEAAVAVCGGGDVERYQVLDQLTLLVDKSLVQADNIGDRTRYRMLETIRHYALEKLGESGEADTIRTAHRDYYGALAAKLDTPGGSNFRALVEQVETDMDNLRAAFAWSRDRGDAPRALELASSLEPLWQGRGRLREGLSWFEAVLCDSEFDLGTVDMALSARALADKAELDSYIAVDSMEQAQQAVVIARDVGDPALLARALAACGCVAGFDVERASPYFAEAIGLARAIGDDWRLSQILVRQAYGAAVTGDLAGATALAGEGIAVGADVGDWFGSHVCQWALGMAQMFRADLTGAGDRYRTMLAAAETDDDLICMVLALVSLSSTLVFQGEVEEGLRVGRAAAEIGTQLNDYAEGSAATVVAFAEVAAGNGSAAYEVTSEAWRRDSVRRGTVAIPVVALSALAAGDVGAAQKLADEGVATMAGWYQVWALTVRVYVAMAQGDNARAPRDACDALSIAADNGSRLLVPDLLECLARLATPISKHTEAARYLGAADAIRRRTGEVRLSLHEDAYQGAISSTRAALGKNDFEDAWAQGAALSSEDAIAYALRGRGERWRPANGWASLTPAEIDVARLVSEGLANKDIAERLFVSPPNGAGTSDPRVRQVERELAGAAGPGGSPPPERRQSRLLTPSGHAHQTRVEGRPRGDRRCGGGNHQRRIAFVPLGEDDLGAVRSVAVRHQPVVQQPIHRAGHIERISLRRVGGRHHRLQRVAMFLAGRFLVHPGTVEQQHRQRQRKALARFGSHDPAPTLPRPGGVDLVHLAEAADHTERRVVELAVEGRRPEQPQRLPGADGEQCRGADDLAGPDVDVQARRLQRRGVLEAQPVQAPMQLQQIVALLFTGGNPPTAQDLAELLRGDDQRIVEGLEVGGGQPVGFVVIGHQRLQRRRHAGRSRPVEADLAVRLDDSRSHRFRRQIITRLLPESATARTSPRIDMP